MASALPIRGPSGGAAPVRPWGLILATGSLAAVLLAAVEMAPTDRPLLLAERFLAGGGWLEALLLSGYAAWLASIMADAGRVSRARRRLWGLFSLVFFALLLVQRPGAVGVHLGALPVLAGVVLSVAARMKAKPALKG